MFLKNLESLRGIAALMVALCHCLLVLTVDGMENIWIASFSELQGVQSAITRFLLIFLNGGAAVVMFFVLSGYVLGLSLDKHRLNIRRTISFYTKRIFRLYPAHIVVLAGIVISMLFLHESRVFDAGSAWYVQWYKSDISTDGIFKNLLLMHVDLNHIAWSLQVELAGSLFLPFAWLVARRAGFALNLILLTALVGLSWYSSNLLLIFLYCFYAGLILPQLYEQLESRLSGSTGVYMLIAGAGLSFFGYTLAGPGSLFGRVLIETIGSMLVIVYLLHPGNSGSGLNRFLNKDLINRLGRYSYSFYLLHFIILYWLAYGMFQVVSSELLSSMPLLFGIGLMVVSVPISYWLAGQIYHRVEVPMIKAGKKLVGD